MMLALAQTFSDYSDSESSVDDPWASYFSERGPRMRGRLPSRQPSGLYVHSSPPTGVPVHDSVVRQWLRGGEMARLKELVLEGEGAGLVGEYSPDITARAFLRALPRILSRIEEAHHWASEGEVERTERAIKRERAVRVELSKDQAGLSLLHKAVIRGHAPLQDWLLRHYPELVHLTDRERRSALHYAGSSGQPEETWRRLTEAGADPGLTDLAGFTPAYYMHHPRRARPPQARPARPRPDRGLVVKPANIRIWIHDRDLGRLQKVVWEGFGQKLLSETSTQPKVRRFLSAVPYILGSIRDVHKSAIENDVETLQKRTADPVPKDILLSKDANGLTPLHKAAGLGQKEAVAEILRRAPEATNAQDALGRTPLHYAAALRDSQLYQALVEAGAVDHLQDKKGNTPSYYRIKPGELEAGKLLTFVPEAPRTAHIFPPSWDWRLLQSGASGVRQESSEGIPQETTTEEIVKDENIEEARPEVSEDEGVGSENAQSVEDTASPQNSENIDMEREDETNSQLDQTITLSRSELFGDDSGAVDVDTEELVDSSQAQENSDAENIENLKETQISESHAEVEMGTTEATVEQENKNDTTDEQGNEDATKEEVQEDSSNEAYLENPIETNEHKEPVRPVVSEETKTSEDLNEQKEEDHAAPEESNTDIPNEANNESEMKAFQENSGVAGEEETAHPPLVRSGTIILQGEGILNLADNAEEPDQDAGVETQEESQKHSDNNEESLENNDGTEKSAVELPAGDEVESQNNQRNSGRSSTKSRQNNSALSGRQSLKSRALKAIELGRGQVDISDTPQNSTNDSDTAPDDVSVGHIKNENSVEIEEEEVISSDNNQEQNVDFINIENESDHQEVNNRLVENEEGNQEITNDNKTEEDNVSKVSTEEYFPDSLEAEVTGDTNEKTAEEVADHQPKETEESRVSRQSSASSQRAISAARREKDRRSEAERLVSAGDMEGMAEMVLAGEGEALLDLTSENPDVQLFINNVPQYMAKIERVHKASREGDLRGVQTSLDRRKFAVARDNGTSLKPTPLHVAVLFGRTSVLRYLAGRFPETMHAQDSGGRTPLHYATTLPDNGHFYSLLITLGADKAVPDSAGRTAEFYLRNKDELTREMLLAEYQDRPVPIDMSGLNFNRYADKAAQRTYGILTEKKLTGAEILREGYPIFKPEEGQYLASTLGEPLIKGLTEVAQLRPPNPIIHLANFLLAFKKPEDAENNHKTMRSIEGTPAGHDGISDENYKLDQNENDEDANNGETEEEGRTEELGEEEEGMDNAEEDSNSSEQGQAFKPVNRDEHGQSMLHFAAARSHGRNAMYQLLQEMDTNPGLRDSLYRTARDIAEQTEIIDNVRGIDRYVVSLAAIGEENKLKELLVEGYDHILDAEDGGNIMDIVEERGHDSILQFLKGITHFEETRDKLHRAIRFGSLAQVQELFSKSDSKHMLAQAKNIQGRCSLHVAVLSQHESTVEYIANKYPETLQIGDNLMRTPLHYAMALDKVESLSRILINAGAQRVLKDLKGRQPSYYFMNKTDIQKLQDEEEAMRY